MFRDPKKSYPSVRIRLVDYKTKDMVDISLPSEYFDETEMDFIKKKAFAALSCSEQIVASIVERIISGKNVAVEEAELSDQEIEAAVFTEEEKDGED